MLDPNSAPGVVLQATGAVAGLTGTWLVNHRNPAGYTLWLVSNVVLMAFQILIGAWLLVGLNLAYIALVIQGLKLHRTKPGKGETAKSLDEISGSQPTLS
jgi:hypothetical protein